MRILAVEMVSCALTASAARTEAQTTAAANPAATGPLTLRQAVSQAVDNYPAVRAALANIQVSAAGVDVARTTYLPRPISCSRLTAAPVTA